MGDKNTLYNIIFYTLVYNVKAFFELRRLPHCSAGVWGQGLAERLAALAGKPATRDGAWLARGRY
eukprot:457315-Heterocapsa_arctica.AAC.1